MDRSGVKEVKTVTLVAHNRPGYTAQAIGALAEALLKPDDQVFDKLIFSIDPGSDEVVAICERASEMLAESGVIECAVYVNVSKFGVAGNTLVALQRAFEEHDSDFNLSIEDDALLTPDAAILANWFYETNGGPASDYALMSMCNHRDFGRGHNPGDIPDNPEYVVEAAHISSPFAWCTTRWQWPYIKSTWNRKELPPNGWDWSLSFAMRLKRMRALHPVLSRCKNIGREDGINETPESFDRLQTGIVYSNGEYPGPYRVVARVPDEELRKIDPWMRTEYERMFSSGL